MYRNIKIDQLINSLQEFNRDIYQFLQEIIRKNENEIADLNSQIQLKETGENAIGISIMNYAPYAPLTIEIKKQKGQRTDIVNLTDTEDFINSFYIEIGNESFEIKANDWKTEELKEKYGEEILGLNEENIHDVIWIYIYPYLIEKLNEKL